MRPFISYALALVTLALSASSLLAAEPPSISGRYPSLSMYNQQGECGTGAVVPWAGKLWVVTYAPHRPTGSDDKLYEISADLSRVIRPESVGGTPADRMIHQETNQLIIGPYFIGQDGTVRVIQQAKMPGRLTAAARHLTDPEHRVYLMDMEGMLYEVDAKTLEVTKLSNRMSVGAHCKGGYSGQGRLVISNNGNIVANKATPDLNPPGYKEDPEAAGVLAEWDGKTWKMLEARQFTDITGPGGISGSPAPDAPLWAIGWDKRSVMLKLLDGGKWQTFRLPIADYSYMPKHGWYTEWPRIREVGDGKMLMNMHGAWFDFPKTFSAQNTAGLRPLGTYLKITGDFCAWNGKLVFGCDDASIMANPLAAQSQSNLWFTTWDGLKNCGQPYGEGGVWAHDAVKKGVPSDPFLFLGHHDSASAAPGLLHLANGSDHAVLFQLQLDVKGHGQWEDAGSAHAIEAKGYGTVDLASLREAEWVRLVTDSDGSDVSAYFHYGVSGGRENKSMADGLKTVTEKAPALAWSVRPLGEAPGTLWFGNAKEGKSYEVTADLKVQPASGEAVAEPATLGMPDKFKLTEDTRSLVLTDSTGVYRLPRSVADLPFRAIREVSTERLLLNAGGSFFMLPYPLPNGPGARQMKPITTHEKQISDFCSWRGLLALVGPHEDGTTNAGGGGHYLTAADGAGIWLGDIDDLWQMGHPHGRGAIWAGTAVQAGEVSDPFLMAGYASKVAHLSHDAARPVKITLEVDFLADGTWSTYKAIEVPPGKSVDEAFPASYSAHWIRAKSDTACQASVSFEYR